MTGNEQVNRPWAVVRDSIGLSSREADAQDENLDDERKEVAHGATRKELRLFNRQGVERGCDTTVSLFILPFYPVDGPQGIENIPPPNVVS